jgi:hypothetical protein
VVAAAADRPSMRMGPTIDAGLMILVSI